MDDEMASAIAAMVRPLHESQTRLLVAATIFAPFFHGEALRAASAKPPQLGSAQTWVGDRAKIKEEMKHALVLADDLIETSKSFKSS